MKMKIIKDKMIRRTKGMIIIKIDLDMSMKMKKIKIIINFIQTVLK
jgi:hypothetical protein